VARQGSRPEKTPRPTRLQNAQGKNPAAEEKSRLNSGLVRYR
jgi:hypothetical protein